MDEREKMQQYFQRTKIKNFDRYCMRFRELNALHEFCETNVFEALCLAFDYGMAKRYRAAKAEKGGATV